MEAPRRISMLQSLQQSTNSNPLLPHLPSPKSSPPPPLSTSVPPYAHPIQPTDFEDDFYTLLALRIAEGNSDFFDSQELLEDVGKKSSCEEPSEDNFDEGEYAFDEYRCLEELLWLAEIQHNLEKFNDTAKKRKRKDQSTRRASTIAHGAPAWAETSEYVEALDGDGCTKRRRKKRGGVRLQGISHRMPR